MTIYSIYFIILVRLIFHINVERVVRWGVNSADFEGKTIMKQWLWDNTWDILMTIIGVLLLGWISWPVMSSNPEEVNWGNYLGRVVFPFFIMTLSWLAIRSDAAGDGHVSWKGLLGAVGFSIGFCILFVASLPDVADSIKALNQIVKEKPIEAPQVFPTNLPSVANAPEQKKVEFQFDKAPDQIIVEIHMPPATKEILLPKEMGGKVYGKYGNKFSLFTQFR